MGGGDGAGAGQTAGDGGLAHDAASPLPTYLDDEDCIAGDREPAYLDDDEDEIQGMGDHPSSGSGLGSGSNNFSGVGAMGGGFSGVGGVGGGAGYGAGAPGQPQWSFFSQSNWMTSRRMAEFAGDDPSIAARLAKAKKKEQERKQEESSRLGRLFSALTGSGR